MPVNNGAFPFRAAVKGVLCIRKESPFETKEAFLADLQLKYSTLKIA